MAKLDILDILKTKNMNPLEFHFENLWIPPINYYLTQQDIDELRSIATSVRLSSKIQQKYNMIDTIMRRRGFKRFAAGTNRVVYRFLEDNRFLVKIAVDKVGMQDNPLEYKNQELLKPFVSKMFYISRCGTVGFCERVLPVKNVEEFKLIASDVFDILINKILGIYVVDDIGTKYFMNWGIRPGFGPVLIDYPYVYQLDGSKLFCNLKDPITGKVCNGEIDYDSGFNHLVCTRCGKIYLANQLQDDNANNKIMILKGGNQMRIAIKVGDEVVYNPVPFDEVMKKPNISKPNNSKLVVAVNRPGVGLTVVSNPTESVKLNPSLLKKDEEDIDTDGVEVTEYDVVEDDSTDMCENNEEENYDEYSDDNCDESDCDDSGAEDDGIVDDLVEVTDDQDILNNDLVDPRPSGTTTPQFNNESTKEVKTQALVPQTTRTIATPINYNSSGFCEEYDSGWPKSKRNKNKNKNKNRNRSYNKPNVIPSK